MKATLSVEQITFTLDVPILQTSLNKSVYLKNENVYYCSNDTV